MNEEYLWDKTGDDPEIKHLESLLAGFKYQEIAPPVLPVTKAAVNEKRLFTWRFSMPLAFAAFLAVAAVAGTWFVNTGLRSVQNEDRASVDLTDTSIDDTPAFANSISTADEHKVLTKIDPVVSSPPSAPRPQFLNIRKPKNGIKHERTVVARERNEIVLTPEEKDAYGRLLLALSITSSKLKIVADTINRTEDAGSPRDPNNR